MVTIRSRALSVAAAAVLLLGGCGLQLDWAKNTTPPATAFETGLHAGYLDLSQSEYGEGDYADSDTFAERVIALSDGAVVLPEEITARELPADSVGDLTGARQRLVSALDATARTKIPGPAARAQVMFDCWMQEQEENFQPADIARCRAGFESAMAEVEDAMRPPPPVAPEPAVRAPVQAPKPSTYTIFFDFDSDGLNDTAGRVVEAILADWAGGASSLTLVGHADSSGPSKYNQGLSVRRAGTVRDALQAGGIGGSRLSDSGLGETQLAVPAADGVREPRNRRVEVTVQ